MKVTKYQHACFTVEKGGQILVVDPGKFSSDFTASEHIVGVTITHDHSDHMDLNQIEIILNKNPDAVIIGPATVTTTLKQASTHAVHAGDTVTVGSFELSFFGGQHAIIHSDNCQCRCHDRPTPLLSW